MLKEKESNLANAMAPIMIARRASVVTRRMAKEEEARRIELMKSVRAMDNLNSKQLTNVVHFFVRRKYTKGEAVFQEGGEWADAYIVSLDANYLGDLFRILNRCWG